MMALRRRAVTFVKTRRVTAWVVLAVILVAPGSLAAQARYDHWDTMVALAKEVGGLSNARAASPAQLSRIADQLLQRGQAYFDLYEFQRVIVRDHARMLDSAAKVGGPSFAATSYYLARALHEMGDVAGATAAYRKAMQTAPMRLRPLAATWAATLGKAGGGGWQQGLADWRRGKSSRSALCAADSVACELFTAIVSDDLPGIVRLQQQLSQRPAPDFVETQRGQNGDVTVEFQDPVVLYLLGVADFVVAAKLGSGNRDADAWRGFALLRAGRYREAEANLRQVVAGGGSRAEQMTPLLGEAAYRLDQRAEAEQCWRAVTGVGLNILSDVKSALGLDSAAVLAQLRAERVRGLDRFIGGAGGGIFLARALLRFNLLADAEDVLAAVRPASQGSRLTTVAPAVLALAAHAEYRRGRLPKYRDRYSFARADLADVAAAAPIVAGMLRQLQELTMVPDGPARSRSLDEMLPEELSDA